MANIVNLKLDIKKGSRRSKVTVTYDICYSHCEVMDNTTFIETVRLKGDDAWPNPDDNLIVLKNSCVSATKRCLKRKFISSIANSILNEDDSIFNRGDEVYAQVNLAPFKPSSTSASSNIISSRF